MIAYFLLDFVLLGIAAVVILRLSDKWQVRTLYGSVAVNVVCCLLAVGYLLVTMIDVGELATQLMTVIVVFALGMAGLFGVLKLGKYAASTAKLYSQVKAHKVNPSTMRTYATEQRVWIPYSGA